MCSCTSPQRSYHQDLSKVWQNEGLNWNATSLILDGDFLYGTTLDKIIFKVDFATGRVIWRRKSSTSYSGQKPLITDNQIFNGGSDVLNSFDTDGNLLWSNQVRSKIGHTIIDYDSLVFASLTGKAFQSFTKYDGTTRWTIEPEYQMLSTSAPSIQDSIIVIGDFDYSLENSLSHTAAINAKNGQTLWTRPNKKHVTGQALLYQNKAFISYDSAYSKGLVAALDLSNGSTLWEVESNPVIHFKPIIFKNSVLIPSYTRGLDCLDLINGDLVWSLDNDNLVPATDLIEFRNKIYYGTLGRKFVSIDSLGNSNVVSEFEYGLGDPLIFKDNLYITDGNGNMFKVNNMP